MKRVTKVLALGTVLCLALMLHGVANAQVQDMLERYAGENGEGYIQPLVTSFGTGLNSGIIHPGGPGTIGIDVYVGLKAIIVQIPDDMRTFTAMTQGLFNPALEAETPTVVGDTKGAVVEGNGGTKYQFPGGFNMKSVGLAVPEVRVGAFAGTEGILRFISADLGEDFGTMSLMGIGLRHSISQYLLLSPVDITVSAMYHSFELGDIISASAFAVNAGVSRSFPIITLYGGLGWENSSMAVDYTFEADGASETVSLDLTGENHFRMTVGMAIRLLLLNINLDYSLGKQNVIMAGVGVGI